MTIIFPSLPTKLQNHALSCLLQSSLASEEELAGMSEPDMKTRLVEGLSLTLNPEVHSM